MALASAGSRVENWAGDPLKPTSTLDGWDPKLVCPKEALRKINFLQTPIITSGACSSSTCGAPVPNYSSTSTTTQRYDIKGCGDSTPLSMLACAALNQAPCSVAGDHAWPDDVGVRVRACVAASLRGCHSTASAHHSHRVSPHIAHDRHLLPRTLHMCRNAPTPALIWGCRWKWW